MILLEKKIVFIHISKNAGTSVTSYLKPYSTQIPANIKSQLWKIGPQHSTYQEYVQALGEMHSDMTFFTVVRNPWDRLVSLYHYWKTCKASGPENTTENGTDLSYISWNGCSFNDWIKLVGTTGNCGRHLAPQLDWLCDSNGDLSGISYLLRFEDLDSPFNEMIASLGLTRSKLKQLNMTKRTDYRDYYNDTSRNIVAKRYHKDIEQFGYSF